MEHFYHVLLGAMITIASTCRHVARASGMAEPDDPLAWEAWLQPGNDLSVTEHGQLRRPPTGQQRRPAEPGTSRKPARRAPTLRTWTN